MARPRFSRAAILLPLIWMVCAPCFAAAGQSKWLELRTDRFVVFSEVSERKSRSIVSELQRFESALSTMTNMPLSERRMPTRIFLLNKDNFARVSVGLGDVAGFFHAHSFQNDIVIDASMDVDASLFTVYHELVHHSIRTYGAMVLPLFYEEAMAQFSSLFFVDGNIIRFGFFPEELRRYAQSSELPLSRLTAVDAASDDYRDPHVQPAFYARALLFQHYCFLGKPELRDAYIRFAGRIANGENNESAFQAEFGMSMEELDKQLDLYTGRAHTLHATLNAGSLPKRVRPETQKVASHDAEVEFAWLLIRLGRADENAGEQLKAALAAAPGHAGALAGLARWATRSGLDAEARDYIEKAVPAAAESPRWLTEVGITLAARVPGSASTLQSKEDEQAMATLRQARDLFRQALARDPQYAEAAFEFSLTHLRLEGDPSESLPVVIDALKAHPQSAELRFVLAIHLDLAGDQQNARDNFHVAACRAANPRLREMIRERIGNVVCLR